MTALECACVWAPRARSVRLELHGECTPLERGADGWWSAERAVEPGSDYGFCVDGEGPFPDPRSRWQPHGVNGLSRGVDLASFRWTDRGWQAPPFASAILYELHVGTFSKRGDFEGVILALEHLVALGVTHVELMPVAEFSGERGWGYDGVQLFAPHHAYGGPVGLQHLVNECHARGLAVILDVVYNHFGPGAEWLGRFGPYVTDRYRTPWGPAVNLDGPESGEVRRFFCDNAKMWLRDYHIDGLRIDAVHALVDTSAHPFLAQLAQEVDELEASCARHLVLIAESDLNDPRTVLSLDAGGLGLDAQWSDDFHHALHCVLTGERTGYYQDFDGLPDLAAALQHGFVVAGRYSAHRRRMHGAVPASVPGWRLVVAAQNHDQVGNRARGERLSQLVSTGLLEVAAALLLTAPFVPMLFQGEEWGAASPFQYFTDHRDPGLAAAVRDGRRGEFAAFGWESEQIPDPQARETFERSRLDWAERERSPHARLLAWHRALIRLRRSRPELADGAYRSVRVAFDAAARWLALRRGDVEVVCNFSAQARDVPVTGACTLLLASRPDVRASAAELRLPPECTAIVLHGEAPA